MQAAELRLSVVYGVETQSNELRVIGSAKVDTNGLALTFGEGVLGQLAAGVFRPFILVAKELHSWPALPPDLGQRELETKIWANPRGKRKDHRPLIWEGWPVEPTLVVLRPSVPPAELDRYEPKQSGFVCRLRNDDGSLTQAEELERVSERIGAAVLAFFDDHGVGGSFIAADLDSYVTEQAGPIAPGSATRIMRDLRARGLVGYTVLDRSRSLYRVDSPQNRTTKDDDTELDTRGEETSEGGGPGAGEDAGAGPLREEGVAGGDDDRAVERCEPGASDGGGRSDERAVRPGHPAPDQRGSSSGDSPSSEDHARPGDGEDHRPSDGVPIAGNGSDVHASGAPVGERWDVQVAWIRAQLAEGRTVAGVAAEIELPVDSVRAARTWKSPGQTLADARAAYEAELEAGQAPVCPCCDRRYTPEELESKRVRPKKKPRSLG